MDVKIFIDLDEAKGDYCQVTLGAKMRSKMLKELLLQTEKIYIFGAQSRAKTLTGYLSYLYPHIFVQAYLVNDAEKNDSEIQSIPVLHLEEFPFLDISVPVFIATKGIYHEVIITILQNLGYSCIIPVTVDMDNMLRNEYVKKVYEEQNRSFVKVDEIVAGIIEVERTDLQGMVYMAKSIYDKPLQIVYNNPIYEKPIQVGAALTEERLEDCKLLDCFGENISVKNRQYCELTALYWIWKNAQEDMIGLAHYRRHFVLPDNWLTIMEQHGIDVILPVPTYVSPSITENYMQRHDPVDWKFLLMYLEHEYPQDYICAKQVFEGNLYSPCNMFIMRKEILDDLCAWMFPILDAVVEHGGIKEDTYLNRYPGFISERLITLYFYKNNDKYKIVYADKNFIA